MAATNYTPIQLYYSTTASATPSSGNLVNGELAINITDEKLYFKNAAGTVKLLASNATSAPVLSFSAGTTGLTPNTATTGAITLSGTLATTNGGTNLTSFTSGGAMYATSSSALTTGTLPNTAGGTGQSGAFTQYGITYASTTTALATTSAGTSTTVLHGNASGAPTFGAVSLTADVSGVLPNTSGGTGQSSAFTQYGITYASSTTALATTAAGTAGQVLTSNGTSAPTWQTSTGVSTGKSIAMAMIFGF